MKKDEKDKILKAGKIASEVVEYSKTFIKKNMLLLEIANKIEAKIKELGGEPAFPTNLSIDEIAAHYTPYPEDKTVARGLLKIDLGVHIDGYISDTAFSLDLENSPENKRIIEAAEESLENVKKILQRGIKTGEIGKEVLRTMISKNANPIVNLSGHQIDRYDLHAGITIPNHADNSENVLEEGVYAIEPFATLGSGKVHDGNPSSIYILKNNKNVRSPIAREILTFITDEYGSLPFCARWLTDEFGNKALLGLNQLEMAGNLHQFAHLIESTKKNVAQAEHTFLIDNDKVIVTTKN